MKILAIETSCDDTAVSIVEVKGSLKRPSFKVLAHNLSSQTEVHQAWGGIVPSLAKREHGRNLIPVLQKSLVDAFGLASNQKNKTQTTDFDSKTKKKIEKLLAREPELLTQFLDFIPSLKKPKIDLIAVTKGPGLEPALWVGINLAQALAVVWGKPLQPINHLEGHILAILGTTNQSINKIKFPLIALIASGGHTELILSTKWLKYRVIGRTRDDAAGEAFDKVARLLGLPYPGGPAIAKLASMSPRPRLGQTRGEASGKFTIKLPRPMLKSGDFDFSFSGLKTAVLYLTQKLDQQGKLSGQTKKLIAHDFQAAVVEVLTTKTFTAANQFQAQTVVVGGGVIANLALREALKKEALKHNLDLLIPELDYSTDNATMIGLAAGLRHLASQQSHNKTQKNLRADGNWHLT